MALPYTFLGKTKMADGHFWVFVARSSAIAYFRTSPPLRHSTVGVLMAVKVSWRFGCAHASSSRRTVINSSLCVYVCMCTMYKCSTCSFSMQLCNSPLSVHLNQSNMLHCILHLQNLYMLFQYIIICSFVIALSVCLSQSDMLVASVFMCVVYVVVASHCSS